MISEDEINSRMRMFKSDLQNLDNMHIISKYFYNDFKPAAISLDMYHELRWDIKEYFKLKSIFNVFLVGSGRLGFSIKPSAQFRKFGEQSDLDVVIVSKELFELYWKQARTSMLTLNYWKNSGVYENYFFEGWMRPDKLRSGGENLDIKNWWKYFGDLSRSRKYGDYSINGGLYYSLDFLEYYQSDAIEKIRNIGDMNNGYNGN